MLHRLLLEFFRFLKEKSHNQKDGRKNAANTKTSTPDRAEVLVIASGGHNVGDEGANNEALGIMLDLSQLKL